MCREGARPEEARTDHECNRHAARRSRKSRAIGGEAGVGGVTIVKSVPPGRGLPAA
jgi:hypothetical protein